jgi:hypothetical protein
MDESACSTRTPSGNVVWSVVFTGEFVVRVILVYRVSASVVLVVTPLVSGMATILTVIWTFWYAFRIRERLTA